MRLSPLTILSVLFLTPVLAQDPSTVVAKWQYGRSACISLTYDDSCINQFRIDMPKQERAWHIIGSNIKSAE